MKKLFTLFLVLAASIGFVSAEIIERVQIGDLYYNLDTDAQTAEVTYQSYTESAYAYNLGWIITSATIPDTVSYQNVSYSVTKIGDSAFSGCHYLTSVVIGNNVTSIDGLAFGGCVSLSSVIMGSNVTSIGEFAFIYCRNLHDLPVTNTIKEIGWFAFGACNFENLVIPASVKTIGEGAFQLNWIFDFNNIQERYPTEPLYDGNGKIQYTIKSITCYRTNPPRVVGYEGGAVSPHCVFASNGEDFPFSSIPLYVPAGSVEIYEGNEFWGDFDVRAIEATRIDATDLQVTPSNNSAQVVWPAVSGAAIYELVIQDNTGNVVCTLIFNSNGQLTSIAFNAPSRDQAPQQTQSTGFSFTVTGLEEGNSYDLTIVAKNDSGATLDEKSVSFITSGEQGFDYISQKPNANSQKLIKDGQILILRGDHTYTLTGQEVN